MRGAPRRGIADGGKAARQRVRRALIDEGVAGDDIGHYQKIVKILAETDRIMKQIELPLD